MAGRMRTFVTDRRTDWQTDRRSWLHRTRRPASSRAGPKILLIANTDISLFSRKGYFYRLDSKTTIKVIGKLNDWTMTSNWKLHAKRLFELEHGVLYIKNSMARDQALLSLFDRTVSPIRELWHRLRPEDQKGPGTLLNYPRKKKWFTSNSLRTHSGPKNTGTRESFPKSLYADRLSNNGHQKPSFLVSSESARLLKNNLRYSERFSPSN